MSETGRPCPIDAQIGEAALNSGEAPASVSVNKNPNPEGEEKRKDEEMSARAKQDGVRLAKIEQPYRPSPPDAGPEELKANLDKLRERVWKEYGIQLNRKGKPSPWSRKSKEKFDELRHDPDGIYDTRDPAEYTVLFNRIIDEIERVVGLIENKR